MAVTVTVEWECQDCGTKLIQPTYNVFPMEDFCIGLPYNWKFWYDKETLEEYYDRLLCERCVDSYGLLK